MFVRLLFLIFRFFFFKQKTAYEMRISDWSSDVCSSDLHGFTVGIDVRGSELFAQVLDAKFAPYPSEVVGGHRVVRVELAAAAVFEMLEPPGYSVPACGRLNGCARGDVAEYADGFIERRAVLTVEPGMDERGCHLWRNGGCRFGHCQSLGPLRLGLFDRLELGQRRADRKSTRLNSSTHFES